ncbi:NAD(P)-binding protein [Colletotrichum eremochloae]|nr:NAD(P)-binding protein [Colletotrichum eremochloae]
MSDLFQLTGRNVIVTGAEGSIGTQISLLLATGGANLLLSDAPEKGMVLYKTCDVAREEEVESLVKRFDEHGSVDAIDTVKVSQEAWDLTYNVSMKGTWHGCKHAVLSMRRHGKIKGSVINTSSIIRLIGLATASLAYTIKLAIVHVREGIRFNALCPGPRQRDMHMILSQDYLGAESAMRARREVHLPQVRLGEPIEQAAVVLFLVSDASSFAYVTPEGPAHAAIPNFSSGMPSVRKG